MQIIPSILVQSQAEFQKQINAITALNGVVSMVQIDLADGVFVPNTTWTWLAPGKAQLYLTIDFELHLMVTSPSKTMTDWKDADHLKKILIHYESIRDVATALAHLRSYEKPLYLVLNPETPIAAIEPYLASVNGVMFMGVVPGRQGQSFIPETIDRIRAFKSRHPHIPVEVDGAVNEKTLPALIAAGVDAVCPGSAIFGNDRTPEENIQHLRQIIEQSAG